MRPRSRLAASVAVLGLVVLAGCGSSSGSSGGSSGTSSTTGSGGSTASTKVDVCRIITPADAEKVIGGPVVVQAPAATEGLSSGVCLYKASGGGIRVSLLQVRVYPGPQFYGDKALPDTKSIDITGADKAFAFVRESAGGRTVDVQFVKHGQTGAINFSDTDATAPTDATADVQAVAQKLADAI